MRKARMQLAIATGRHGNLSGQRQGCSNILDKERVDICFSIQQALSGNSAFKAMNPANLPSLVVTSLDLVWWGWDHVYLRISRDFYGVLLQLAKAGPCACNLWQTIMSRGKTRGDVVELEGSLNAVFGRARTLCVRCRVKS